MIYFVFLFFVFLFDLQSTNQLCAINNCQVTKVTIITIVFTELHIIFNVNINILY